MNKQKVSQSLNYRVRLWPIAARKIPNGPWQPRIDDDWRVSEVSARGVVRLNNLRTGHFVLLGSDRIHHFEDEPQREGDGFKHGMFVLHTQLVLSGCNVFYFPLQRSRAH